MSRGLWDMKGALSTPGGGVGYARGSAPCGSRLVPGRLLLGGVRGWVAARVASCRAAALVSRASALAFVAAPFAGDVRVDGFLAVAAAGYARGDADAEGGRPWPRLRSTGLNESRGFLPWMPWMLDPRPLLFFREALGTGAAAPIKGRAVVKSCQHISQSCLRELGRVAKACSVALGIQQARHIDDLLPKTPRCGLAFQAQALTPSKLPCLNRKPRRSASPAARSLIDRAHGRVQLEGVS